MDNPQFVPDDGISIEESLLNAQDIAENVELFWSKQCEQIVEQLLEMATELDGMKFICNIIQVSSAGIGVAGGVFALTALVLAPEIAVIVLAAGIIGGLGAAATNGITGTVKAVKTKRLAKAAEILLHEDRKRLDTVVKAIEARDELLKDIIQRERARNKSRNLADGVSLAAIGLAPFPRIAATVVRFVLEDVAFIPGAALRGISAGAGVFGIATDAVILIINARDLARGSRSKYAAQLRKIADELEEERDRMHRKFVQHLAEPSNDEEDPVCLVNDED